MSCYLSILCCWPPPPGTSLDIDKVNLDSYVHHNVNITGFRLIDPESWPVQQYLKKFPNSGTGRSNIIMFCIL